MSAYTSPFTKRLAEKLRDSIDYRHSYIDARAVQRAFVAALKEEVEARFGGTEAMTTPFATIGVPLRIAGLGSFKMKTRLARSFIDPQDITGTKYIPKPAARCLALTSKWKEIK